MRWLITGAAGFIGFHLSERVLSEGDEVVGVDCMTPYYDIGLKRSRLERLIGRDGFGYLPLDLTDGPAAVDAIRDARCDVIVHLAAQPGVRYALVNPRSYVQSNLVGFANVLDAAVAAETPHLIYASSSSVYGATSPQPFSEHVPADHPISLYAATKRSNELMAHSYSSLHGLRATGLRFFSVYGPWGRPDMAYYAFTRAIFDGDPITVHGDGTALRDFTYIDDIVEGIHRLARIPPDGDPAWTAQGGDAATSPSPWRLYNIGHGELVTVNRLIEIIEQLVGRPAIRQHGDPVPGDVPVTLADTSDLAKVTGFSPAWRIEDGMATFVDWYRTYHRGPAPR